MKRIVLLFVAFLAAGVVLIPLLGRTGGYDFEKMWDEVGQASQGDLPATAQAIVRKIYNAAAEHGDAFQRLRAADKMLELKHKEAAEPNQQLKTMIARQIEGVDKAIDTAVYGLYGLTEDEIMVVEGE